MRKTLKVFNINNYIISRFYAIICLEILYKVPNHMIPLLYKCHSSSNHVKNCDSHVKQIQFDIMT